MQSLQHANWRAHGPHCSRSQHLLLPHWPPHLQMFMATSPPSDEAHDSAHQTRQLNSTQLNTTQLNSTQLNSTQLDSDDEEFGETGQRSALERAPEHAPAIEQILESWRGDTRAFPTSGAPAEQVVHRLEAKLGASNLLEPIRHVLQYLVQRQVRPRLRSKGRAEPASLLPRPRRHQPRVEVRRDEADRRGGCGQQGVRGRPNGDGARQTPRRGAH